MNCQLQQPGSSLIYNTLSQPGNLEEAYALGNITLINFFLKNSSLSIDTINDVFVDAIEKGDLEVFQILLKDPRVDPIGKGQAKHYPFVAASKYGRLEMLKELLSDKRIILEDCKENALFWARQKKHKAIVDILTSPNDDKMEGPKDCAPPLVMKKKNFLKKIFNH